MTDMLTEYDTHREQGHGHHAALLALARRFDLDKDTVGRVIDRAQREQHRRAGRVQKGHDRQPFTRPSAARAEEIR